MFVPDDPGVPGETWRMNTALISEPLEPEIHTSANPVTGTVHMPLQPFQLTTGSTVARTSFKVCEDHVPLGSEAFPAATRSLTPWPIGPTLAPGSLVNISPTLIVQEHPLARFCRKSYLRCRLRQVPAHNPDPRLRFVSLSIAHRCMWCRRRVRLEPHCWRKQARTEPPRKWRLR